MYRTCLFCRVYTNSWIFPSSVFPWLQLGESESANMVGIQIIQLQNNIYIYTLVRDIQLNFCDIPPFGGKRKGGNNSVHTRSNTTWHQTTKYFEHCNHRGHTRRPTLPICVYCISCLYWLDWLSVWAAAAPCLRNQTIYIYIERENIAFFSCCEVKDIRSRLNGYPTLEGLWHSATDANRSTMNPCLKHMPQASCCRSSSPWGGGEKNAERKEHACATPSQTLGF